MTDPTTHRLLVEAYEEGFRAALKAASGPVEATHSGAVYNAAHAHATRSLDRALRSSPTAPTAPTPVEPSEPVKAGHICLTCGADAGEPHQHDDIGEPDQCGVIGDPRDVSSPVCVLAPGHAGEHRRAVYSTAPIAAPGPLTKEREAETAALRDALVRRDKAEADKATAYDSGDETAYDEACERWGAAEGDVLDLGGELAPYFLAALDASRTALAEAERLRDDALRAGHATAARLAEAEERLSLSLRAWEDAGVKDAAALVDMAAKIAATVESMERRAAAAEAEIETLVDRLDAVIPATPMLPLVERIEHAISSLADEVGRRRAQRIPPHLLARREAQRGEGGGAEGGGREVGRRRATYARGGHEGP